MQRNRKIVKVLLPVFLAFFVVGSWAYKVSASTQEHPQEDTLHVSETIHHTETDKNHAEAAHPDGHAGNHEAKEEKLDAGKVIVEHVTDAHDWHIASIGGHHYSIPLPVIIKDDRGFHTFSSSRFHHGHATYEGYGLEGSSIVAMNADGTVNHEASFYDFSITKNVAAMFIASITLCLIMLAVAGSYKRKGVAAPSGITSFVEPLVIFLRDEVIKPSIGPRYEKFLPYLLTIFFFIFITNLFGLLPIFPGGANVTGNVAVTLVLALFTFIITSINANGAYWKHIVMPPGVPGWLLPLMIVIEIIGMLSKPIVLTIRLFANITAGHIIILGFLSLIFIFGENSAGLGLGVSVVSVAFAVFMFMLELLVAFLQAYVFTLLSALYFGMAVEEHAHADHH